METAFPVFLFIVLTLTIAYVLRRYFVRPVYLAKAEYWVYSQEANLPDETQLFERLIGANPYIQKGQNPIGPAEGLIFSDVRFKMSLMKREKNPKFFHPHPDEPLFEELTEALTHSKSIVRLQYVSQTPLRSKTHLQFLPHLADAVANLTNAQFVRDCVTKKFISQADLSTQLSGKFDVTDRKFHVDLIEHDDHTFETSGLPKVGVSDIHTLPVSHDQIRLAREILESYIDRIWSDMQVSEEPIEAYGDQFHVIRGATKNGKTMIRVIRQQAK